VDASKSDSDYIHLAAWYDRDNDGLLDALQEPHAQPHVTLRGANYNLVYFFSNRAKQWSGPDGSQISEITEYNLFIKKNLISLKTAWLISGSIQAKDNDKVLDFWDGKMKVGAFSSAKTAFQPGLEKITPTSGFTQVNTDGSYSLSVNPNNNNKANIHLIAWHDRDKDDKLDAKTEPYAQAVFDRDGKDFFNYLYSNEDFIWILHKEKNIPAGDSSNLTLFMNNHVPSLDWHLSGKLDPLPGNIFDLADDNIRLGAFYSNAKGFNFLVEDNEPEAGYTLVNADSSFVLKLYANDISFKFLFIVVWYDSDGDGKLDAQTENYSLMQNDKYFNTQEVYYTSEAGKVKLTYWRNGQINRPASQDSILILVPSGDITRK
jgi:hypothetical protein